MSKNSAGILFYRFRAKELEVLLAHPGGPFWAKKEMGAWSIPKGEIEPGEDLWKAAIRETSEETGIMAQGKSMALTPLKQKSGKIIHAWAVQQPNYPLEIKSNSFEMEWPPKSGRKKVFPEIDKVAWFNTSEAKLKIVPGQLSFISELEELISDNREKSSTQR